MARFDDAASGLSAKAGKPQMNPYVAWSIVIVAGGSWGVSFSLAKIVAAGGYHPFTITFWHTIFGILILLAACAVIRAPVPFHRRHVAFYTVCGLFGTALPSSLLFYAAKWLDAGILSILIATVPMMTLVLAVPLGQEKFRLVRFAGVMLGLVAVGLIAWPEMSLPQAGMLIWILAALASAWCYAVENLLIAMRAPPGVHTVALVAGMMIGGVVILLPVLVLTGTFDGLVWPLTGIELAMAAMAFINVFSYGLFFYLVTHAGPVFASQTAYAVTVSGVFWGILIFGESHSVWIWAALTLMLAGLFLVRPAKV